LKAIATQIQTFIERRLNRQYVQHICLIILVVISLTLGISFATQKSGRTSFGPFLGADFAAFYDAGSIFNSYPAERIYDRGLHREFYQRLFPSAPADSELPYVNAPFFILPFPLLARLPYQWAYFMWVLISIGLYVAGLKLLWGTQDAMPKSTWTTSLLLGLSFMPFLVECLAGGQTSAFGFFWLALALRLDKQGREILSGMALAFCFYKPTLLLLILPMLIICRRSSVFLGVTIGGLGLAALSLALVGWQGCLNYVEMLLHFTSQSTSAVSGLKNWKYVDLNSFFRLLAGGHTYIRWVMSLAAACIIVPMLFWGWWKAKPERETDRSLVWAFTISWTMALNIYLGIYDTTLVVLSILLTTNVLYREAASDQPAMNPTYKNLLLLLYLVPWITQIVAESTSVQLYTLILAACGLYQLRLFHTFSKQSDLQCQIRTAS
jgi:hypothetical protein